MYRNDRLIQALSAGSAAVPGVGSEVSISPGFCATTLGGF